MRRKKQHASCNRQSEIYTLKSSGVLAQLVERLNGIEEVTGSNPVGSTPFYKGQANEPVIFAAAGARPSSVLHFI